MSNRQSLDWRSVLAVAPLALVVTDERGCVSFANAAAAAALGTPREALLGRPVEHAVGSSRLRDPDLVGPGGERVFFLEAPLSTAALRELEQARFAIEVADSLAGTLNLRRTLTRVVHLAVPTLGEWAAVVLWDGDELRLMRRGPGAEEAESRLPERTIEPGSLRALEEAMGGELQEVVLEHPGQLRAFGFDEHLSERLCGDRSARLAVAPLTAHGSQLGVLLVAVDPADRLQRNGLAALAHRAAVAIGAAKVYDERSALAATLRASLLPNALPEVPGLRLGAAYRPAERAAQIGGDFYDLQRDTSGWSLSLGDVCGKGVEAAVLTGQVRQSIRTVIPLATGPAERLRLLNAAMFQMDGTSYVTVVHAKLRPTSEGLELCVACGGHPPPLVRHADGSVEALATSGTLIGMMPKVRFDEVRFVLTPGETLLCYTDGLSDARGPDDRFGTERIAAVLTDSGGMTSQAIAERLLERAIDHASGAQRDDIAIVAVQVDPAERAR